MNKYQELLKEYGVIAEHGNDDYLDRFEYSTELCEIIDKQGNSIIYHSAETYGDYVVVKEQPKGVFEKVTDFSSEEDFAIEDFWYDLDDKDISSWQSIKIYNDRVQELYDEWKEEQ